MSKEALYIHTGKTNGTSATVALETRRSTGTSSQTRIPFLRNYFFQVQTRSADEPMTTFVYCQECGNRWKVCANTKFQPQIQSWLRVRNIKFCFIFSFADDVIMSSLRIRIYWRAGNFEFISEMTLLFNKLYENFLKLFEDFIAMYKVRINFMVTVCAYTVRYIRSGSYYKIIENETCLLSPTLKSRFP